MSIERFNLDHHLHRKIKYCLASTEKPALQDAVMDLICGEKLGWDHDEWEVKLQELEACDLTIGEVLHNDGVLVK